jgi:DNA-binding transcriptional MerR regulator
MADDRRVQLVFGGEVDGSLDQATERVAGGLGKVEAKTKSGEQGLSAFGSQVLSTATGMAVAELGIGSLEAAFSTLIGFVTDSVHSFAEAESAQRRVESAMRATGSYLPSLSNYYSQLAGEIQDKTAFADDAIMRAISTLISLGRVGPNEMRTVLLATTDLAAAMDGDLLGAATAVAKAADGQTTALRKQGIQVDETALKTEGLGAVVAAIEARYRGFAEGELGTINGQLRQQANDWDDVKEAVGRFMAPGVSAGLRVMKDATVGLSAGLADTSATAKDAKVSLEELRKAMPDAFTPAQLAGKTLAEIMATGSAQTKEWTANTTQFGSALGDSLARGIRIEELRNVTKGLTSDIKGLSDEERKEIIAADAAGISQQVIVDTLKLRSEAVAAVLERHRDEVEASKEAQRADKDRRDAIAELNASLLDLDVNEIAYIRTLVDRGEQETAIAKALGVRVSLVKQIKTGLEQERDAEKAAGDAARAEHEADVKRSEEEMGRFFANLGIVKAAEQKAAETRAALTTSEFDQKRAAVAQWVADEQAKVQTSVAGWEQAYDAIADAAAAAYDQIAAEESIAVMKSAVAANQTRSVWVDLFDEIPGIIQASLSGGGNPLDAILSNVGGKAGKSLAESLLAKGAFDGLGHKVGQLFGVNAEAAFGMAIPGVGAAVGAALGPALTKLKGLFHKDEFEAIGEELAGAYGQGFSTGLSKVIAETSKQLVGGTKQQRRELAEALSLSKIIDEMGGVTPENVQKIIAGMQPLFDAVSRKSKDSGQAVAAIGDVFAQLAPVGLSTTSLIDAGLEKVIQQARSLGLSIEAIDRALATQRESSAAGFAAALGVTQSAYDSLDAAMAEKASLEAERHDASIERQAELDAKIKTVSATIETQQAIIDATGLHSQAAADAVAGGVLAVINANMAAGDSFVTAVKKAQPQIEALEEQFARSGFTGSAAFDLVRGQVALATDAVSGPALEAVHGLTQGWLGLNNAGLGNEEIFRGVAGQITHTFTSLVEGGKDGGAVMAAMQDDLQAIWEAQRRYGYAVDDSTQALLDEAEQAGLVGEAHKSSLDQMVDGIKEVSADLKELIAVLTGGVAGAFRVVGRTATDAFTDITGQIDRLPRDISFRVSVDDRALEGLGGGGSGEPDVPAFASEAYVRRPTLAMVGDVAGGEFVLKPATIARWMQGAAAAGAAATGGVGAGAAGPLTVQLMLGRDVLSSVVVDISREAMANGQLPVPARAIAGRATN